MAAFYSNLLITGFSLFMCYICTDPSLNSSTHFVSEKKKLLHFRFSSVYSTCGKENIYSRVFRIQFALYIFLGTSVSFIYLFTAYSRDGLFIHIDISFESFESFDYQNLDLCSTMTSHIGVWQMTAACVYIIYIRW